MILLKIQLGGVHRTRFYRMPGYIDKEEEITRIIWLSWLLFGRILIYRRRVFEEEIPLWADIGWSTIGMSSFKSKRQNLVTAAIKKRVIKTIKWG